MAMTPDNSGQASPSDQHRPATATAHSHSFTAVNGVNAANSRPSPKLGASDSHSERATSSPTEGSHKMNGIIHLDASPKSSKSSPSMNDSLGPGQADTPDSQRSPPIRKRSYPEAFGNPERRDDGPGQHVNAETQQAEDYSRASNDDQDSSANHVKSERDRPPPSETDPHAPMGHNYYPSRSQALGDSEQRLAAAALRRESETSIARKELPPVLPSSEDPSRQQFTEYDRGSPAVQMDNMNDRKRRKRMFSNRTKTGCMTCRKRKKKCDEQHPECNNCLRGGFVCEGYTGRNTWQKPSQNKQPVHLASKDGPYRSPAQQSQPQQPPPPQQQPGAQPPPSHYQDINNDYGRRSEIKPMDDGRRMSPHNEPPRPPQNWSSVPPPYGPPHPPPPQKYPERPIEPQRPSMAQHDNPHEIPDPTAPYPMTSAHLNQAGPPPPQPHTMTPQHQHQPPPHGPPPPPHSANPHQPGQPIALPPPSVASPVQKRPQSHHRAEMSERDKMLRGEYYLPYTPALVADREQCALAVWRFNNSTNPATGIAPDDRMKFFRQIFSLRPTPDPSVPPVGPHDPPPDPAFVPNGSVGNGVVVEAPFHCDYGYNVTIGNEVVIGADCRITDTCTVTIGNNVVFSPGVKLVCATYAIDPRERKKGKGRALGRQIIVEDDSWIGSNVTILPGVRVGRCSTVGAGSLLHKDVPPFTVVAGNPPKVVRGIYDDGSSRS